MIKPLQSITLTNEGGEDTTYVVATAPAIVETTEPADVASFSDGAEGLPVSSLIADINPVQNLNGQSAPYPAGGGKNKLPSPTSTTKTHNGITISVANGVYSINGTASATSEIIFDLPTDVTYNNTTKCAFLNDFANSNVVVYWRYNNTNGASQGMNSTNYVKEYTNTTPGTFNKVRFLISSGTAISGTVHLSPVLIPKSETNPTAYIPYSNICPITGWTGMNVVRTGKNLWNPHLYTGIDYNVAAGTQITLSDSAEQMTDDGNGVFTLSTSATWKSYCFVISVKTGVSYRLTFSITTTGTTGTTWGYLDKDNKVLTSTFSTAVTQNKAETLTPPEGAKFYYLMFTNRTTASETITITQPRLELGTTASEYEPYNGTTYPISWADEAGTVYGGYVDVPNRKLIVTRASVDLSDMSVGTAGSGYVWSKSLTNPLTVPNSQIADIISEAYIPIRYNAIASSVNYIALRDNGTLYVNNGSGTTPPTGKAIYALSTPTEVDLDIDTVTTVLGTNNIWADTGDVEVAYCADTKMYIAKVIAEL